MLLSIRLLKLANINVSQLVIATYNESSLHLVSDKLSIVPLIKAEAFTSLGCPVSVPKCRREKHCRCNLIVWTCDFW